MTNINRSFPSRVPPAQAAGSRPPVVKVDGDCLIIKNVQFENGKRYDIRIHRWDSEGNDISVNVGDLFSISAIQRVSELAKNIFSTYGNPTNHRIIYTEGPEESCLQESLSDPDRVTDLVACGSAIVSRARQIHQVLNPLLSVECSRDPNVRLVIQATQEIPAPKPTFQKPAAPAIESDPVVVPGVTAPKFETTHPSPFLKGITFSDLCTYAKQKDKSNGKHPLFRVYHAFKQLVENPTLEGIEDGRKREEMNQMKAWVLSLYKEAYNHYKTYNQFSYMQRKHYAASSVVLFVRCRVNPQLLIEHLKLTN